MGGRSATPSGAIYLVRHGETVFNAEGRLQGRVDSPLTATGEHDAQAVADFLMQLDPALVMAAICASPLGRAATTARILRDRIGMERTIQFDDRVVEVFFGSWEGLTRDQIAARWPESKDIPSMRRAWARYCPDGEKPDAATARLDAWLQDRHGELTIAVTHSISRALLIASYAGLTEEQMFALPVDHHIVFKLDRGEVTMLDTSKAAPS